MLSAVPNNPNVECEAMDQQLGEVLEPEPPCFSEEIWRAIFQYLYPYQLLDARLVCRHWNWIIASNSTLMDKVVLRVNDEEILDDWLLPTNETKFRKVEISYYLIPEEIFGWTTRALNSITSLILNECVVQFQLLLDLLKEMPILCSLDIKAYIEGEVPEAIDFKVHSLEELKLEDSTTITKMIKMFSQICCRLKRLSINREHSFSNANKDIEQKKALIELIQANRNSLEWIELNKEYDFWIEVAEIEGLRLKRIQIYNFNNTQLIPIVRKYSALENLSLQEFIPDETFLEMARNLPQLKSIDLVMDGFNDPSMFSNFCMPQLKHVHLHSRRPYYQILGSSFPNIHSVELNGATIKNWPELFDSLAELKNLNRLKLGDIRATEPSDEGFKSLKSLNYLKLCFCSIPKTVFSLLITQSPDLREVHFRYMYDLDDDDILIVCTKLRLLRKLSLKYCENPTENSVDHIIKYCQSLEKVTFIFCRFIHYDSVDRINTERKEIHAIWG